MSSTFLRNAQNNYNRLIEQSVARATELMKAVPDMSFQFAFASKGNLDMVGHDDNAQMIFRVMECGNHSLSSINMAFDQVTDAAMDMGRPVDTRKIDGKLIVTIKPVEPSQG